MTFENLCERLTALGGELVEESAAEELEGVDFSDLKACDFKSSACFALPIERSYLELRAVAYTACRMIIVYAFDDGEEADFALFGVPYLDYAYERAVRAAILK